ncbi:MAG: 2-oxoacid:acceptor oxidoreductase family protein [bacterium]|nr:2-oxoacid:acceptor oxidoreductase family protein [bacterium]MBK8129560.1 2-oxoacid:acceptor oxidoreductase family protein [bacterium]
MRTEIRFAGVGGQGNILAGEWVALAAHNMGLNALQSPTYTAQVRGGPTSVDVLIDSQPIGYPRLTKIDFFLCLAQSAWGFFSKNLRDDTIIVVDPNLVSKMTPGPQMIYPIPIIQITKQTVEKPVYTSAVSLGIFCRLMTTIPQQAMIDTIEQNAPAGTVERNLKAFRVGWETVETITPVPRDQLVPASA